MFYPPCCYVLMTYSNIFTLLIRVCVCVCIVSDQCTCWYIWMINALSIVSRRVHSYTHTMHMYVLLHKNKNKSYLCMDAPLSVSVYFLLFTFYWLSIIKCIVTLWHVMLCFFSMCACMSVYCVEHVKRVLIQLMQCYFCCFLFVFHANNIVSLFL